MDLHWRTQILSHLHRPTRYLGREINAIYKDPRGVALRVALVFPDLYEVGMSHLGLALLYDLLNQREEVWAERVFAPAPDLEGELRTRRTLLGSLESGTPLKDFDLVGVSLQYELGYTNLLNILELGGIPLLAAERRSWDPVVVAGGPAAFNPEPVAPFFDAVVLGDGEEVVMELADVVKMWKAAVGSRQELWQALEDLPGVYVPALYDMVFDEVGRLREIIPRGRRGVIGKRVLDDLDRVMPSPYPLVPLCRPIHDRLNVELSRGCTRGCRYCQAGMIYRPVRERQPEALEKWVGAALTATGYEELSLLSLSPGDYQALPELLKGLMDHLAPQRVALSLPSLRADTLTPEVISQIERVRRTGLTIAPEAGSERLRRVINKNLPEEAILAAAQRVFAHGWRLLKLYFMIGLPEETPADLEAIALLVRRLQKCAPGGRIPQFHVSLSTFIPKPHTPFQWEAQANLDQGRERLHAVKDFLRGKNLQVKWNSVAQSWLEGIFSRGDRRLAPVLLRAFRLGCRLDAWSEHLRLPLWRQAFEETNVSPDFYLRAREVDELLPWQHLSCGVSLEFLQEERERAYQGRETPDCRLAGCHGCGVCDDGHITLRLSRPGTRGNAAPCQESSSGYNHPSEAGAPPIQAILVNREQPVLDTKDPERRRGRSEPKSRPAEGRPPKSEPLLSWYRLTFTKLEDMRWLSHLELISVWYRGLRRAGVPLAFTEGHHPMPRVIFHGALPVGLESVAETVDVALTQTLPAVTVVDKLNQVLPPGLKVLYAQKLPRRLPPPPVARVVYEVASPEPVFHWEDASRFLAQEEMLVRRQRPQETRNINIRPLVAALMVQDRHHVQLTVKVEEKDNVKAADIVAAVFGLNPGQTAALQIMKTKAVTRES